MGSRNILNDDAKLWAYLSFGYLPTIPTAESLAILKHADTNVHGNGCTSDIETVVSKAAHILRTSTELLASSKRHSKHVILLSGGHDSRAILGSMIEVLDRTQIVACTYGYPGNEELEIASRVAKAAGVEHHRILVAKTNWSTEELVNSARCRAFPPSFVIGARFQNYRIYKEFGIDSTFWDGILGDALTGGHLRSTTPFTDWQSALEAFIRYNRSSALKLAPPEYNPLTALPFNPLYPPSELAFDDQLDIAIRQTCYIANRIPTEYTTMTPYSQERFWRFWLSLPRNLRHNQMIYKRALLSAFPRLFSIPVAGGRGRIEASRWEKRVSSYRRRATLLIGRVLGHRSPYANPHRQISDEMRDNRSLRNVMSENIADLARRKRVTWLDVNRLWSEHLTGAADYGDALRILVSLEIALKIEEMDR